MKSLPLILFMGLALSLILWAGLQVAGISPPLYIVLGAGLGLAAALQVALRAVIQPDLTAEQKQQARTAELEAQGLGATARVQQQLEAGEMPDPIDIAQSSREMQRKYPTQPRTPFQQQPPIILARAPRAGVTDEAAARSYFGGTPTLGTVAWPLGPDAIPKHLLAQIDMAELQDAAPNSYLPETGVLAFFADPAWPMNGTVIYSAHPDYNRPSPVPPKAVPPFATEDWRDYYPGRTDAEKPLTHPRVPITFTPLNLPTDYETPAFEAAMAQHFPPNAEHFLGAGFLKEHMTEDGAPIVYWDAGHRLANELRHALANVGATKAGKLKSIEYTKGVLSRDAAHEDRRKDNIARYEAELKALEDGASQFEDLVLEVADFAFKHDRLSRVSPQGLKWFSMIFDAISPHRHNREKSQFGVFVDTYSFHYMDFDKLRIDSLINMATGPLADFQTLPPSAQKAIDDHYNRTTYASRQHQMFGLGTDVQGAASDNAGNHLLLQLHYDTMMHWIWGDMGVLQFWISEDDLRAKRWDKVTTTMEAS